MPGGVVFVVYIPTGDYEHMVRFGNKRDLVSLKGSLKGSVGKVNESADNGNFMLQVELRNKTSRSQSIPMHMTSNYFSNNAFNPSLENITEDDELITMEMILQELLPKLGVEAATWRGTGLGEPGTGRYLQVVFPCPTGPRCETALHCLTKLGIGVSCRSSVNVLPCSVVHSAMDSEQYEEEDLMKSQQAHRWRAFVESIRSKLTVQQVVDGVRGGGELSFDYLTLILTAGSLAALGLVENNASNIVAAMLVSPLMGPVMSITFGAIISDRTLVRNGFESLAVGMLASLVFGFVFGLVLGTTAMPWGFGDWPTEEMKGRGNARSLWMGVLWALTSGTGVALALLQGSAGPLIGIAISASLLPPVVNCGLYWALACIWLLYPGVKIPHLKGEEYSGNSSYVPLYHDYLPIEFAVNGIVSCCLTVVNVICIFITAILFLKIKEVAAPYTSTPDLRRFWQRDVALAREANRAMVREERDERTHLVLDELAAGSDEETKERLESAVREALDDDTYRKVKRMSYQSHNADEVMRSIGLSSQKSTPPKRTSAVHSGAGTPREASRAPTADDIAALDKLLTKLLGHGRPPRASGSRQGTPRASRPPTGYDELARHPDAWPERILENTIVQSVLTNLKAQQRSSRTGEAEEDLLLQK